MAPTWYGSTAGSNSGSAYASASTTLTPTGAFPPTVHAIRFHAVDADTYTLRINGAPVGTVAASAGTDATLTLTTPHTLTAAATFSLSGTASRRVRYATGTGPTLGGAITLGAWVEFAGAYWLPWEVYADIPQITAWTTLVPAAITAPGHPAPAALVVPSGGATPVPTSGRGYPRGNR